MTWTIEQSWTARAALNARIFQAAAGIQSMDQENGKMTARTGWMGALKTVLGSIETTHTPRPGPDNDNIVDIPKGLDRLRKAIIALNNDLVEAQAERADYIQAWSDCQQEINAALSRNTSRQSQVRHRLARLQEEWAGITAELGIRAEVVPSPIDDTLPDGLVRVIEHRD